MSDIVAVETNARAAEMVSEKLGGMVKRQQILAAGWIAISGKVLDRWQNGSKTEREIVLKGLLELCQRGGFKEACIFGVLNDSPKFLSYTAVDHSFDLPSAFSGDTV